MRIVTALVALMMAVCAWAQPAPLTGYDAFVEKAMKDFAVPGLSIAVVKDDKVVLAKGYGVRKMGSPERVDADTVFAIASLSKAFTAASLAMLVDEGKIGWDDPVTRHLPWFQMYDAWVTREITVRDLLCHRSGLPAYGGDVLSFFSPKPREEIVRSLRYLKPATSFRSRWAYQNNMYLTAGEVLRAVSGQTWDEFVAARIFTPLGMTRSSTSVRAFPKDGNVATPHAKIGDESRIIDWPNWDSTGAAGAINSTARDMAEWMRLQLATGERDGKRLFSAAASREMWSAQMVTSAPPGNPASRLPRPKFTAYGMGWSIFDYQGRKVVTHSGGLTGMTSRLVLIPEEKLGVIVLTSAEIPIQYSLVYRAVDAMLGLPATDWSALYLESMKQGAARQKEAAAKRFPPRIESAKPSLAMSAYAGKYKNDMLGAVDIDAAGNGLKIRLSGLASDIEGAVEVWNYDAFRITWKDPTWPKTFLIFQLNANGQVEGARMELAEFADPSFDFENYPMRRVDDKK